MGSGASAVAFQTCGKESFCAISQDGANVLGLCRCNGEGVKLMPVGYARGYTMVSDYRWLEGDCVVWKTVLPETRTPS